MLAILPASVNVIGRALRYGSVSIELYTSVLPSVFEVITCGFWVTVTVLLVTPEPAIVTVADLGLVPVLAVFAVTVIVPLFIPDNGDTSSQLPSSVILQLVFEVMLNVPLDPDPEPSETLVGDTFKNGADEMVNTAFDTSVGLPSVSLTRTRQFVDGALGMVHE
jgi:hypothetical protein